MSFLEMLDVVNERLIADGKEPIAFDHDCREGICGSCGMMINGRPHGPERGTATCQLHMRKFRDGDHVTIEPWRAAALPARQGPHRRPQRVRPHHRGGRLHRRRHRRRARRQPHPDPEGRSPTRRWTRPRASAAARASPRARTAPRSCSPSAKLQHLNLMPQGQAERWDRTVEHGRDDGDVLRLVHEPPRVRGRVPEVDLDRLHRADEPRLREGAAQAAPPRRPVVPVVGSAASGGTASRSGRGRGRAYSWSRRSLGARAPPTGGSSRASRTPRRERRTTARAAS